MRASRRRKRKENKNLYKIITLGLAALIMLYILTPNIAKCVMNGRKSRHLSLLYNINHRLEEVLEHEIENGEFTWRSLLGENNSEKILLTVSSELFDGKLKVEDYYIENDGQVLRISSAKYPEVKALQMIIPEE